MKTKLLLLLLSSIIFNLSHSQVNTLLEGDRMDVFDLTIDNNGNQIIVGDLRHSTISNYYNDFDPSNNTFSLPNINSLNGVTGFVTSYSKSGQLNYAFQINDADITPSVQNILIESDSANNIYIYGSFTGKADFDPSNNISELSTATVFTTGNFIASYDENGNFRFAIPFPINSFTNTFTTIPKILSVDNLGNSYLLFTNLSNTSFDFDNGSGEFFINTATNVISYDSNGDFRFGYQVPTRTKAIGCNTLGNHFISGTLLETFDANFDFDPTSNIFTLGNIDNSSFFFASYSKDGELNFVKDLKGPNAAPVKILGNNTHIFITGEMGAGTIDFDPSSNTFNVAVSGFEFDTGDMFFAKYTSSGDLVYAKAIQDKVGKVSSETITDTEIDIDGNIYLTGNLKGGVIDFDLSANVAEVNGAPLIISNTPGDLFVASYDGNGDYKFAYSVTGSFINHSILETDPTCSFYYVSATESYDTTLEFYQENTPFQFTTGDTFGREYPFITKIKEGNMVNGVCSVLAINENNDAITNITLLPMPIENELKINTQNSNIKILKTEIYNTLGQTVYSSLENKTDIDLSTLNSGIYILNLETNLGKSSFKIVKK